MLLLLHLPLRLKSHPLSLPLPVNPTVSFVAPVPADTTFDNTFDIVTLIMPVILVLMSLYFYDNIIEQNSPTFPAAMSTSVAVTYSELKQHFLPCF